MAKVICTLPNAPGKVNGFLFTEDRGQMISQDLSDADAAYFASIPGYKLFVPPAPPTKTGKGEAT